MFNNLSTPELIDQLEKSGDRASLELVQAILERGNEAVPHLRSVLKNKEYWEASDDRQWMPLHAVKLLGTIADPEALPELIDASVRAVEADNDWVMEDLPTVFDCIGSQAVEPLMKFILAHTGDNELWWPRTAAADGLASIAFHHPEERERITSFLHGLFSENEDSEFSGSVADALVDLNDPSSIPVLERAFGLGYIDEEIISGDELEEIGEIKEEIPIEYRRDLLEFYDPDEVARRKERWEQEKRERELLEAEKREKKEKILAQELKRLEIAMELSDRNLLPRFRKAGRNDPCPCGSGKKFKKCHLPLLNAAPPKQILGKSDYATLDLQRAPPYDPVLVLGNLTFLAIKSEDEGDVAEAMEIFRKLEALAERSESRMLGNLLHDWAGICSNHPELGEEGLRIMRRLQSFYKDKDREKWAFAIMDEADYLDHLGRREEGLQEYEELLKEMPDFHRVHIRFARFQEKGGRFDEAVYHYKQVLLMEDQIDMSDLLMAAQELKDLATSRGIELDPETRKAIERLLE